MTHCGFTVAICGPAALCYLLLCLFKRSSHTLPYERSHLMISVFTLTAVSLGRHGVNLEPCKIKVQLFKQSDIKQHGRNPSVNLI